MTFIPIIYIVSLITLLYFLKIVFSSGKQRAPLPPGPKPKPIIGNLTDLPPPGVKEWLHWARHKDLYGPISSVTAFGQTLIILNDPQYAFELLEKRSAFHSSRPKMIFAGEMVGWEDGIVMQPYGDRLRASRRYAGRVLGSAAKVSRFHALQDVEVRRFLLRVLRSPEDLQKHIRTEAAAIILKMTYDYTIKPHGNDPIVDLTNEAAAQFTLASVPGAWMVDVIPFLRYLPDWFPGTGFKQTAREWRKSVENVVQKPYSYVRHQMKIGNYQPSFVSELLDKGELSPEEDFVVKWAAISLYTGGADTTVSSITCFFLAMTLFPEVQRRAQDEIDRVIGPNGLPGPDDRENLPYIEAIVKEVLRWHPVVPMGAAHMTTENDIFEGYRIPKGAYIMPNIWGYFHDPKTYHDPMTFKPERFLSENGHVPEPDPQTIAFGFGRRICPGRFLADSAVYLTITKSLAVFQIGKYVENGKEIDPVVEFQNGLISHPAPYKISVRPRSVVHEALIRSVEIDYPWEKGDAAVLESLDV